MNSVSIVARTSVCALLISAAVAADDAKLLDEFRKTNPSVSQVHVIAEFPLLVAATGQQGWGKGELLGVFARRGEQIVNISMVPNDNFPTGVRIDSETADSITFALGDPDLREHTDNLKIFFDPKTYFPKRMVRFAPVQVRRIAIVAGVLTLYGSDEKQDFKAQDRNGTWRVSAGPATPAPAPRPVESELQINPNRAAPFPQVADERIGPYEKVGTRIWVGKTFVALPGTVGVGDIGYFDILKQDWIFLHIPEMADWSASALLVEPAAIWVGLVHRAEDGNTAGGLLRYDRATHKVMTIPLSDPIDEITRVGTRLYCATNAGFAVIEHDRARRFEFSPQLDGSYAITPVT